jgi:hypothetical protein
MAAFAVYLGIAGIVFGPWRVVAVLVTIFAALTTWVLGWTLVKYWA